MVSANFFAVAVGDSSVDAEATLLRLLALAITTVGVQWLGYDRDPRSSLGRPPIDDEVKIRLTPYVRPTAYRPDETRSMNAVVLSPFSSTYRI